MVAAEKEESNSNNNNNGGRIRTRTRRLIFTYGTLKKGFSNHGLIDDMKSTGDASFLGLYKTAEKLPLVCGPYRVPFLLNFPGSGYRVFGELYEVSTRGLALMDELEGTTRCHYQRLPVKLLPVNDDEEEDHEDAISNVMWAEAYYAHSSYAERLWKVGLLLLSNYTQKETKGYVKRKDRPPHLTFLDHIRLFLLSSSSSYSRDHQLT